MRKTLCATAIAAVAMLTNLTAAAEAAVVYQSIPDLYAAPGSRTWCSTCGGVFEPLQQITLSAAASITGFDLATAAGANGLTGAFSIEIYNSTHTSIVFSQAVSPSLKDTTTHGGDIITALVRG